MSASLVRLVFWWKLGGISAKPDKVLQLPSRDLGRTIKVNFYRSKSNKPAPVLINFHGSGFTIPWHGTDDEFARQVVQSTEYAVLDVAYRLAPEYPFPAAIHDFEDVVKWVIFNQDDFDSSRVSVSGFSAGANLALVASTQLFPHDTFRHVICFYPPTDLAKDHYTKVPPDPNGNPLPPWMLAVFTECYASGLDWKDPKYRLYMLRKIPSSEICWSSPVPTTIFVPRGRLWSEEYVMLKANKPWYIEEWRIVTMHGISYMMQGLPKKMLRTRPTI